MGFPFCCNKAKTVTNAEWYVVSCCEVFWQRYPNPKRLRNVLILISSNIRLPEEDSWETHLWLKVLET
jgi:hypothetical protein